MGRPRSASYTLTGTLRAVSPLHVGSGFSAPGLDRTVAVDGLGRPVVPGTALTGVLREALADDLLARAGHDHAACERLTARLFGDESSNGASAVVIDDAVLIRDTHIDVRDGVGIDRVRSTAAPGHLYNREVLAPGSTFEVRLRVDEQPGDDGNRPSRHSDESDAVWLVQAIADRLSLGIRVGAEVTRGLGSVAGEELTIMASTELDTKSGMLRLLRGQSTAVDWTPPTDPKRRIPSFGLEIRVRWQPASPVMVGVSAEGAADRIPATSTRIRADGSEEARLVMHGSGIKGALRARAEYILRTLLTAPDVEPAGGVRSRGNLLDDSSDDRLPEALWLFGRPRPRDEETATTASSPGRAALQVADCLSATTLDAEHWQAVRLALDAQHPPAQTQGATPQQKRRQAKALRSAERQALGDRLDSLGFESMRFILSDHVAVDRWTGGAAEGRLFCVVEPHAVIWEPLTLTLDLSRARNNHPERALLLLLFVLRDLQDGWIPLGGGTRQGLGQIDVAGIDISLGHELEKNWGALAALFDADHADHAEALRLMRAETQKWREYIESRRAELAEGAA